MDSQAMHLLDTQRKESQEGRFNHHWSEEAKNVLKSHLGGQERMTEQQPCAQRTHHIPVRNFDTIKERGNGNKD